MVPPPLFLRRGGMSKRVSNARERARARVGFLKMHSESEVGDF